MSLRCRLWHLNVQEELPLLVQPAMSRSVILVSLGCVGYERRLAGVGESDCSLQLIDGNVVIRRDWYRCGRDRSGGRLRCWSGSRCGLRSRCWLRAWSWSRCWRRLRLGRRLRTSILTRENRFCSACVCVRHIPVLVLVAT